MPTRKLTESFARTVDANSRIYYWDPQVPGFGLRVSPSRSPSRPPHKVWVFRFRSPRATNRRPEKRLGPYPIIDCAAARDLARQLFISVAAGDDPSRERRKRAVIVTMRDLCTRYEARMATFSPKTARSYQSMIKTHVLHTKYGIGDLSVVDIEKDDIQALVDAISEQVGRKGTRLVGQAKKVKAFLGTLFNFAIEESVLSPGASPLRGIRVDARRRDWELDKIDPVGHTFEPEETARVWQAFAEATIHEAAADALRLIALTGVRSDEARLLRWNDIVLDSPFPHLAVRRHKRDVRHPIKEVPLSAGAIEILRARGPGLPAAYVFPSPVDASKPVGDLWTQWTRVRDLARVPRARVHDLRGLAACHLAAAGWSEAQIQIFMGWDSPEMVRKYVAASQDMKARGAKILDFGVRRGA